jgi:hypothetical protein
MSSICAARIARLCIVIAGAALAAGQAEAQVRTVLISPTPGASPTTNGARLLSRYAAIADASATNPYLVKIEPGIYDFKDRSLIMRPFIDIEGSGEGVTTLRSQVESAGTVAGVGDTELRLLTIENTATTSAVALRNASPAFSARDVTCVATNASSATAILQGSASDVTLRSVTARATGFSATGIHLAGGLLVDAVAQVIAGDLGYAVFNQSSNGELVNVTAEADSRRFAGGIRNEAGAPILRTIRAFAHGDTIAEAIVNGNATGAQIYGAVIRATAGSTAVGVSNEFTSGFIGQADITAEAPTLAIGVSNQFRGSPTLQGVRIRATAGGRGIGVGTENGVTASILSSDIQGDGASVANNPGATAVTRVGSSRLIGPVRPGTGTMTCVASHNGSFTPLGPTCVP